MASLWILTALMALLALLFVAVPVLRFRESDKTSDIEIRKQKNIEVFQQRELELEQDFAEGLMDREQYGRLKAELERLFLREMEQFEREQAAQERRKARGRYSRLAPLALALLVPLSAFLIYQQRGSAPDLALPGILEDLRGAQTAEAQEAALRELAGFLAERFERHPDDVRNGYMLGTLYLQLEEYPAAVDVFARLEQQVDNAQDRATILGQLAQARYLQADQEITPEVRAVMDQALALNPNEYAVMSLLAIDAFLNEDLAGAVQYWQRQLSQVTPGSNDARVLQERIAQVQELIPESERPGDEQVAANAGARLEVRVEVAEALQDRVSDDMRVFVFARNPAGGPPVAAQTFSAAELPLTITLDDSNAMMPQLTLSTAQTVVVGARISKSGTATAQSGDFEAITEPFELAEQEGPIELTISDVVP